MNKLTNAELKSVERLNMGEANLNDFETLYFSGWLETAMKSRRGVLVNQQRLANTNPSESLNAGFVPLPNS